MKLKNTRERAAINKSVTVDREACITFSQLLGCGRTARRRFVHYASSAAARSCTARPRAPVERRSASELSWSHRPRICRRPAMSRHQTTIMETGQPPEERQESPRLWDEARQYKRRLCSGSSGQQFDEPVHTNTHT